MFRSNKFFKYLGTLAQVEERTRELKSLRGVVGASPTRAAFYKKAWI